STIGINLSEHDEKILVVMDNDSEVNQQSFNQQLYAHKEMVLEKDLESVDLNKYKFVTYFSDKFIYEEYHLDDMFNAFNYVEVDFGTKDDNHEAHNYISVINDKYKTIFDIQALTVERDEMSLTNGYNLDYIEILNVEEVPVKSTVEKELSVIVPIHNNGTYLEEKCFASLKRSSSFD